MPSVVLCHVVPPSRLRHSPAEAAATAISPPRLVREHLVHVVVDGQRRLEGEAAVDRARDTTDVDVHEQRAVGGRAHRAHLERHAHRVPGVATRHRVETVERFDRARLRCDAQHTRIGGAGEHGRADRGDGGEVGVGLRQWRPRAVGAVLPDLLAVDDRQPRAAGPGGERLDPVPLERGQVLPARGEDVVAVDRRHEHAHRRSILRRGAAPSRVRCPHAPSHARRDEAAQLRGHRRHGARTRHAPCCAPSA